VKLDILIKNGKVIDGCGNPWYRADLGIKNGEIAKIGKISETKANKIIDAKGLVIAPGFIDIHSHDDVIFFKDPLNKPKLQQGVTTVAIGNCGISVAPVNEKTLPFLKECSRVLGTKIDFTKWKSFAEFLNGLNHIQLGMNIISLVGHGTLRIAVMGMKNKQPNMKELLQMKKLLAQSMEEGSFGMSSGLIYPPGVYSKTEELVELCKVVSSYGGIYSTHIRGEGDTISEAIEEALEIGVKANVPVEISHCKVPGKSNWGNSVKILNCIKKARENGIDVTIDAYPYIAGSTGLTALFPPWALVGGEKKFIKKVKSEKIRAEIKKDMEKNTNWFNFLKLSEGWQDVIIASTSRHHEYEGKSLKKIAQELNKDPFEILFNLAIEEGSKCSVLVFMMHEKDVERIVCDSTAAVITDAIHDNGGGKLHPRGFGTFPRILGSYVREKGLISLEDAIKKMTSLPAQRFNLKAKGLLKEGFDADITIFNSETIIDKATYQNPQKKTRWH